MDITIKDDNINVVIKMIRSYKTKESRIAVINDYVRALTFAKGVLLLPEGHILRKQPTAMLLKKEWFKQVMSFNGLSDDYMLFESKLTRGRYEACIIDEDYSLTLEDNDRDLLQFKAAIFKETKVVIRTEPLKKYLLKLMAENFNPDTEIKAPPIHAGFIDETKKDEDDDIPVWEITGIKPVDHTPPEGHVNKEETTK